MFHRNGWRGGCGLCLSPALRKPLCCADAHLHPSCAYWSRWQRVALSMALRPTWQHVGLWEPGQAEKWGPQKLTWEWPNSCT